MQVHILLDVPVPAPSAGSLGKLKILTFLRAAREVSDVGGLTDNELVDFTGLAINIVTARRNELWQDGRLYKTRYRRMNAGTGRSGTVWAVL